MANAKLKCKQCKNYFLRESMVKTPAGNFCSYEHATEFASAKVLGDREKQARKKHRERKEAVRPRSWYVKQAQMWFNRFIRLRDAGKPCICCDRPDDGLHQRHAGHYLTTSARPEHRFNEDNCHAQTSYCNNYLSGNVAEYRKRLIKKIGLTKVEAMEQDHAPKKYTIEQLKGITEKYKNKCKQLDS